MHVLHGQEYVHMIFFKKSNFNSVKLTGMNHPKSRNSAAPLMVLCCKAQLQALLSVAGPHLTALDYRFSAVLYWQIADTTPQTVIA